jgi:hypothetical protein
VKNLHRHQTLNIHNKENILLYGFDPTWTQTTKATATKHPRPKVLAKPDIFASSRNDRPGPRLEIDDRFANLKVRVTSLAPVSIKFTNHRFPSPGRRVHLARCQYSLLGRMPRPAGARPGAGGATLARLPPRTADRSGAVRAGRGGRRRPAALVRGSGTMTLGTPISSCTQKTQVTVTVTVATVTASKSR